MLNYTIERKESFQIAVTMRTFDQYDSDGISRFWFDYFGKGNNQFAFGQYGYRTATQEDGTVRYGMGNACITEADGTYTFYFGKMKCAELPPGFELITIPAMTWAKIEVIGPVESVIHDMYSKMRAEWPQDLEIITGFTLEEYSYCNILHEPHQDDYRSFIWIPVRVRENSGLMKMPMYRLATIGDIDTILCFVRELAEYEKSPESFVATPELLKKWMCDRKIVESQLVYLNGEAVGFALYFFNFSTWLGRAGIYIEDVYIRPAFRKHGIGRELFRRIAQKAVREGCGRMEWCCLEWNTPSLEFYKNLGAIRMDGWKTLRLTGEALENLGKKD